MKVIFETKRLTIKKIEKNDKLHFSRLLSDLAIVSSIPQPPFSETEIKEKFDKAIDAPITILESRVTILGVYPKNESTLIGLCAFLTNNDEDKELGYRFLEEFWGKGFATELTKGAIDFCFNELNIKKLTADVALKNTESVKVLERYFSFVKEFYNEADLCVDKRYELVNQKWVNTT